MQAENLIALLERRMPYGKYKGLPLAELPLPYLVWFARQGWPKGELGRLLELAHELKHNGLMALLEPLRRGPTQR